MRKGGHKLLGLAVYGLQINQVRKAVDKELGLDQ